MIPPATKELIRQFKDPQGDNLVLTPTQEKIAETIIFKTHDRVAAITPTQYGKSMSVGVGVNVAALSFPETYTVIAPTKQKTEILMGYCIALLFTNSIFTSQLKIEGSLEKLRRSRRKDNLTFKRGGRIRSLTADAVNMKKIGALLGEGSQNVIIDESPLIPDPIYTFIRRMLGGRKKTFLFETGNPIIRNHFEKTMRSQRFLRIWINYEIAMREGRFDQSFIDEMKELKFFDILYECKFPTSDLVDSRGFYPLLSHDMIDSCWISEPPEFKTGRGKGGADIGGGGNLNSFAGRWDNYAQILYTDQEIDTMTTKDNLKGCFTDAGVKPEDIGIDNNGIGAGVHDQLRKEGWLVRGVKYGNAVRDPDFKNVKAQVYWWMKLSIEAGLKIVYNERLEKQLKEAKYKPANDKTIRMETKEEMAIRGVESPDEMDSLANTYFDPVQTKFAKGVLTVPGRNVKTETVQLTEDQQKAKHLEDMNTLHSEIIGTVRRNLTK